MPSGGGTCFRVLQRRENDCREIAVFGGFRNLGDLILRLRLNVNKDNMDD